MIVVSVMTAYNREVKEVNVATVAVPTEGAFGSLVSYLANPRNLSCRRRKSLRAALNVGDPKQIDQEVYIILDGLELKALLHPVEAQREEAWRVIISLCGVEGDMVVFIRETLSHLMEVRKCNTAQTAAIARMEFAA